MKNKTPGYVPLLLVSALTLLPLLFLLSTSLKTYPEVMQAPPTLFPKKPHWENYAEIFRAFPFWRYIANTLILAGAQTLGTLISSAMVAWGFARYPGRWNTLVFTVLLTTMMLPGQITAIPIFASFVKLGFYNSYFPLIFPAWLGCGAFYVFLLRQFFVSIPKDVLDAARIDGASEWVVFFKIAIPLCKPILWTVAIFSLINSWNDYFGPLIYLNDEKLYPISLGLTYFQQSSRGAFGTQWHLMMAASLITLLPVMVLFFFAQRSFINSIISGALKQ